MKTAFHPPFAAEPPEHIDGAWMCSPDGSDEPHDRSRGNAPMLIAAVVVVLPILFASVILLARYFIKG